MRRSRAAVDELETLPAEVAYDRALDVAMKFLARRSRSRHEVRERLLRAGFEAEADKVDARLVELSILDDAAFAHEWAEHGVRARGLSAGAVRRELISKGLSEEVVAPVLSEVEADHSEADRALHVARRRVRAYRRLAPQAAHRRLYSYLRNKGFEDVLAAEVCRRVLDEQGA